MTQVRRSEEEWRQALGDEAYRVLRREGTERPFTRSVVCRSVVGHRSVGREYCLVLGSFIRSVGRKVGCCKALHRFMRQNMAGMYQPPSIDRKVGAARLDAKNPVLQVSLIAGGMECAVRFRWL